MNLQKTTKPCFSNGYEWDRWAEHNCDKCYKNSYEKPDGTYTRLRCSIQRDIFAQAMGMEEIYVRSFDATQREECPLFRLKPRPCARHKSRKLDFTPPNQTIIEFPD